MRTLSRLPLAVAWTLQVAIAPLAAGDGPGERYRLIAAEDAPRLERRLQSAAAEGYRLLAAAEGIDVAGKPRIAALMERGGRDPAAYRVLSCAALDDAGTSGRLAELGADGYRLHPQGITARRLRDVWLADSTYDDQLTLVLERAGDGSRYTFETLAFGDHEPFHRELARLRADRHEVVGMWNTGRKLQLVLQKRSDANAGDAPPEIREHRLLLLPTRLALAGRLESAAGDGFRILAAADPSITGPPVILLEKTAAPGNLVDYRFLDDLPVQQSRDALVKKLNQRARKGWRVARHGTTTEVVTLERPAEESAGDAAAEYRVLSSRRAPGLERSLERSVGEGFELVRLFVEPDETTVLVERVAPRR
jgi:hypothetical protein